MKTILTNLVARKNDTSIYLSDTGFALSYDEKELGELFWTCFPDKKKVTDLSITSGSDVNEGVDVTDDVITKLLGYVFGSQNMKAAKLLGIPEGVVLKFKNGARKSCIHPSGFWTRNGVIPNCIELECRDKRTLTLAPTEQDDVHLSLSTSNTPNIVQMVGGQSIARTLASIGEYIKTYCQPYGIPVKHAVNISRITDVDVCEKTKFEFPAEKSSFRTVTEEKVDVKTLGGESASHDGDTVSETLTDKLPKLDDDVVAYIATVCLPLSNFMGLCYMGNGLIGNTSTGEVIEPGRTDYGLFYYVPDYLGVEGNTVAFPFDLIQNSIHAFTSTPTLPYPVWGNHNGPDCKELGGKQLSSIAWWVHK